jgi:Tol biopolymer transport system component/DNA-binding winged helix-turn-helix (wHTH) protein
MNPHGANFYLFDKFRLDPKEKVLWRDDSIVDVTPRSVEILVVLVEHAGQIVSKDEIFRRVWTESFVEEANLSHHISRLRKALGENEDQKFIETVSKRGYRFVGAIHRSDNTTVIAGSKSENETFTERRLNKPAAYGRKLFLILGLILLIVGGAIFSWLKFAEVRSQGSGNSPGVATQGQMSITRITNNGKLGAATISPDGKFIAYSENSTEGAGMLYIRQTETNSEVPMLEPGERMFGSKAFSPDNAYIYYITYDTRDPEGALYRIPVIGGQPTRLLGDVRNMFSLSPDGKRVTFFRDDPQEKRKSLVIASLDGAGEQIVLTRNYAEMELNACPAFSPDGRLIAFAGSDRSSGGMDVWAVDVASGELKKITVKPLVDAGMMTWMPDGTGIVFVGALPQNGNQIYLLEYSSGELRRITKELNNYGNYGLGVTSDGQKLVADLWDTSSQLWTTDIQTEPKNGDQLTSGISDGSRGLAALADGSIVYATRTGDDVDLWRMSERGGKREGKPLTADAFYETDITATHDDRYLVFASDRGGGQHLFRMELDGSNITQLTSGTGFESAPDCSPDGNFVVYASTVNSQTTVWKISMDGGIPVRLTEYECVAPSFSPDAKWIACVKPTDEVGKMASIAVIPAAGGNPEKSFDVMPFGWNYNPVRWTPDGKALIFAIRDRRPGNLWKQNLSGGEPKQFTDFNSEMIFNFAVSPDGKRLVLSRGETKVNVVMIKNFAPRLDH